MAEVGLDAAPVSDEPLVGFDHRPGCLDPQPLGVASLHLAKVLEGLVERGEGRLAG